MSKINEVARFDPCLGSVHMKGPHEKNHIYEVMIYFMDDDGNPVKEPESKGWMSMDDANDLYPDGKSSGSHGICPECVPFFKK